MNSNNLSLTTLSENPEYFEEVIKLIEEGFHYSESHHYEKDFAPLVDPLNFENCFIYIDKENNSVAAHLAVCIRTLIKNDCETKVALLGGIVTNKKYRNKGLFKNLMEYVLHTYETKVSLFILWSDLEGLYERFNFFRTGGVLETGKKNLSSNERPSGYEKTKFSLLSEKDFNRITHLYTAFNQKYFFTVKRDEKDWSIIKDMNSIDLFIKRNSSCEIQKYFCINKGRDLTNIIHEVSCVDLTEYMSTLKELSDYRLWLPETEIENITSKEIFYTAFMKLGDKNLLNMFLDKISKKQLIIKEISSNVVFEYQDKSYNVSDKEFLQYLFGPRPLTEFISFKLSLYIAGVDSI